jgi:AcrR family transcriptional regulator
MGGSRAESQRLTRGRILDAAEAEFAEHGYRAARIDSVAARAGLTRGAVYSNFPGKRALFLTVLCRLAERAPAPPGSPPPGGARAALGALAGAWMTRVAAGEASPGRALDLIDDEELGIPLAELLRLNALVLALAVESLQQPPAAVAAKPMRRWVRTADVVLTTLYGAARLPGQVEPFDVVSACEHLAGLALNDWWSPPAATISSRPSARPWSPPPAVDLISGRPTGLAGDGVLAVLGLHRLAAAEDTVRGLPAGVPLTLVVVTGRPEEFGPLIRLVIGDLAACLRVAFRAETRSRLRVVCDDSGALAAAAGVTAVSDATESAVLVAGGRVVLRADGHGSGHAVARSAVSPHGAEPVRR